MDHSPQLWTTVHKFGLNSTKVDQIFTNVDYSPQLWTSNHMDHCSVNAEHVQPGSLSLVFKRIIVMDS